VITIREELVRRPLLLDGGLSTTLEALGHDISGELWSARLLRDEPAAVVAAHRAFFDAGSDVATSATYQATFDGFAQQGIDRGETASLMRRGVQLARQAAESNERPTWVAASAGPYGAMLADGSEYHGRYGIGVDALRHFHRERFEVLAEAGADLVAFETLPCAAEVEAVLSEVAGSGVDCWISVSIEGGSTRAGEPLDEVLTMAAGVDEVVAVGVNCSTPSDATAAVHLAATTGRPAIVYPNSGEGWDAVRRTWEPASSAPAFPVERWVADGARLVGGCCRVTPSDIAAMAAQLAERTPTAER
jgi:S-methylmethionine-dependent homocysteine/selenocysteine methylase